MAIKTKQQILAKGSVERKEEADPWAMIKVDTSKFSPKIQEGLWLYFDGSSGECNGIVDMQLGTFLDVMEAYEVIVQNGEEFEPEDQADNTVKQPDDLIERLLTEPIQIEGEKCGK